MSYCSSCGRKVLAEANFCPKCGRRIMKGEETNVASTSDDLREIFNKIEQEFEKAWAIAAKEMQAAFNTAKENVQQSLRKELVVCSSCGEKNSNNAAFCRKCGKKMEVATAGGKE
jgi:uncharacterized OB-fold protein